MPENESSAASPLNAKLSASSLDFLLIELVPLAQRISEQVQARDKALREEYDRSRVFNRQRQRASSNATTDGKNKSEVTSLGFPVLTPPLANAMTKRLEEVGYRVGQGLAEGLSAFKPRPTSPLDVIKFICKDLWTAIFQKPIDNLKTNHRGVFVLADNSFRPIAKMSMDLKEGVRGREEGLSRAQLYLVFPSGIIRGALSGLGIEATVEGNTTDIPVATFQIKT
ncbi:BET3 family protein [Piedraia hortae CBS 480.64]|uniref:BET3 family protein n=1 Tax=Piedraia hortae CBS 480.64 TaxID=1314780 RepID=A0A6A7C3U3_9PEZI|nr:BET3 family protein [Piedraia hortae CBS 480.64]